MRGSRRPGTARRCATRAPPRTARDRRHRAGCATASARNAAAAAAAQRCLQRCPALGCPCPHVGSYVWPSTFLPWDKSAMRIWRLMAFAALAYMNAAHGQLLPQVQVPPVRVPDVSSPPLPTDPLVRDAAGTLARLPTRAVRRDQLLRQHGAELDRDNHGELVVRAEVLAIDITDA